MSFTAANTWFSTEPGKKGQIKVGQLADLAVLSDDYFSIPEDEIQDITSVLTVLGGKVVHAAGDFGALAPPLPPATPDWSPTKHYGGYQARVIPHAQSVAAACSVHDHAHRLSHSVPASNPDAFWGAFGCSCWAF